MSGPLVVVLGASSFIGSAVNRALATRPIRLRLIGNGNVPRVPAGTVADIEVGTTDLTVPGAVAAAVDGASVVVHLVAHTAGGWRVSDGDRAAERVNVGLVRDLVQAFAVRRSGPAPPVVLFAGTGLNGDDRADATAPDRTAYCRQKLRAEHILETATAAGVLRGVSLRLGSVYGHAPANDPRAVEIMIRRALSGLPLTMWHDGSVCRDLIHLDDVASAFVAALDNIDTLTGRHWPVGTGRGEPLVAAFTAIAQIVAQFTGRPAVPVVSVPPPAHAIASDLADLVLDTAPFRAATGWRSRVTLRDGLLRTVVALAGRTTRLHPAPTGRLREAVGSGT